VAFTILAAFAITSCDDQNFDWEKAKSENSEYNYAQNFQKIYGDIDPNQSWDFSTGINGITYTSTTRANVTFVPGNSWSSNYYQVQQPTLDYIKETLRFEDQDNTPKGTAFSCVMPDNDFDIIPVFQGMNDADVLRLYMDVADYGTYLIWTKGQNLQKKNYSSSSWTDVGNGNTGTFVSINIKNPTLASAIQGKILTVSKDCFEPGSIISFFTMVRNGALVSYGQYEDYEGYPERGTYNGTPTGNYLKYYFSTRKPLPYQPNSGTYDADKPYILAMTDCPTPTNVGTTNGIPNEAMLIACEGGGDKDLNDVVFLVVGRPYLPKVRPVEGTEIISKRYMVEDMGYSANGSAAVAKGYTDIDFNDIVIDFYKSRDYVDKFNGSKFVSRTYKGTDWDYSAKVRALGGTWDFILYVNGKPIFQKGKATTSTYYATGYSASNQNASMRVKCPAVSFNPSHLGSGFEAFDPAWIYNTGLSSVGGRHGDGKYPTTKAEFKTSYLCEITSGLSEWDPNTNNISFKIVDSDYPTDSDLSSSSDGSNVYSFTFPSKGACPKIVAFDNPTANLEDANKEAKQWQREKVPVTSGWFGSNTISVDDKGAIIEFQ